MNARDASTGLPILVREPSKPRWTPAEERPDGPWHHALRDGTIAWIHIADPSDAVISLLARDFDIHPLAVEDLRRKRQRPKLDSYEEQHHLVAYEATADAERGLAEVQVLFGATWVISVRWQPTPLVDAVHDRLTRATDQISDTVAGLVYLLLDAATDSYFPALDRVSDRLEDIEDTVVEGASDPATLKEILALKRELLEHRRVLTPMRDVANALLRGDGDLVTTDVRPYYQDLYDHLVRVLDQLDLSRDLLAAVLDVRMSAVSNDLNATMRRLTAVTVVIMIPTLIAGIYGMNFEGMPELSWPFGYPAALALMAVCAVVAIAVLRRRGWF